MTDAGARTPLRVLYLTPPAAGATALAAQSFVAEEIRAIRSWNVAPYVLTDESRNSTTVHGVPLIGVPGPGLQSLTALVSSLLRHARVSSEVARAGRSKRDLIHALRIEAAAADVVARERIDVIHSHFGWPYGFGGSVAARATGRPLVTSVRGTDILTRPEIGYGLRLDPGYDVALGHLLRHATLVLAATVFMRTHVLALGTPPGRIRLLEKGVDTRRFTPVADRSAAKARLGLEGPVLLAVGALKKRKGLDVLIDALAGLSTPVTLVICGEGEEQPALQGHAAAAGVAARIRFAGLIGREAIGHYFAAADVFVHPAELEAAGNVVLEALASGCAVVVTDSGGPSEYVEDGVNGFVVPVGDSQALAMRVDGLLQNARLRAEVSAYARRRIERRHCYERMMGDLRSVYEEACGMCAPWAAHL